MRKTTKAPGVDLFPFMSILAQTMGCILIVLVLMMIKVMTGTHPLAAQLVQGRGVSPKIPVYVDCFPEKVNLYQSLFVDVPIQSSHTAGEALADDGKLARFFDRLNPQKQYIIFLVREGGEPLYRQLKKELALRGIEYGGGFPWRYDDVIDYEKRLRQEGVKFFSAPEAQQ